MSILQRAIVCAGLAVMTAATLFPPWVEQGSSNLGTVDAATHGLGWVLTARAAEYSLIRPDYGRLAVEWASIVAMTGCAFVAAGQKKEGRSG